MKKNSIFHSVTLDEDECCGCTNCIKQCPTEAIRVTNGKARIDNNRCIDCGMCIRVCPHHAKKALTDNLSRIENFKYKVAIPAPSLYGQFKEKISINQILNGLTSIGFNDVYEVAAGAEIATYITKEILEKKSIKKPVISSSCPAVVKLIQLRFPDLVDNLLRIEPPMEIAARLAREKAIEDTSLDSSEIGVFFITPCAAKYISVKQPIGYDKSNVDGVFPIGDVVLKILKNLDKIGIKKDYELAGLLGVNWANSGGESGGLSILKTLAVDGIHNVITILEEIEDDRMEDIDFIETMACYGGCIGGPLNSENVFVAKANLMNHLKEIPKRTTKIMDSNKLKDIGEKIAWTKDVEIKDVFALDEDISIALKKLEDMGKILEKFPLLDCGSCGAPSCKALAEDIVMGKAIETDCIFVLRNRVKDLAKEMVELSNVLPPSIGKEDL